MDLDGWESYVRTAGAAIAGLGLAVFVAGLFLLAVESTDLAIRVAVGGLVVGLVGALLLLLAPDTLPPRER